MLLNNTDLSAVVALALPFYTITCYAYNVHSPLPTHPLHLGGIWMATVNGITISGDTIILLLWKYRSEILTI
jgi:hypothetical protein